MTPGRSKVLAFYAALTVFVFIVLEVASFLVFHYVLEGRDFMYKELDQIKHFMREEHLEEQADLYDRDLGWVYPAGLSKEFDISEDYTWGFRMDERGARFNPYPGSDRHISVYGDSYAFGADVNDDETWCYYLSELLGTRVENWGTPAYGTDQALLRVKKNFEKYPTDIVILSVFEENINRIMSSYWPFYTFALTLKIGFKPMLHETENGYEWLPNPLREVGPLAAFHAAFDTARKVDYWYQLNERAPRSSFPYTVSALRAILFQFEKPPSNLFEYPPAAARLDRILTEFVQLGDQLGFTPVIVFLPRMGQPHEPFHGYVRRIAEMAPFRETLLIDILDSEFDRDRYGNKATKGHLSPYGNQVVANIVAERIRDWPAIVDSLSSWSLDGVGQTTH